MSLLVVGSVALDTLETPFDKMDDALGGSATYISITSSYFTSSVYMVGVVGEDFDKAHIDLLKSKKVDLEGLQIIEGGKTFRWGGKYLDDFNQRETLFTHLNVFEHFDPVIPESKRNADFVILGNIHPGLQMNVLNQINNPKMIVCDTMNLWINIALEELKEVIKRVDVLIINDEEAKMLTGDNNLIRAADQIMEMGPKYLIIKKGEHGAMMFHEDKVFSAPAFPVKNLYDPTGAGDTFAAGFTAWLDKTNDLGFDNMKKAVVYGSVMASFTVEKFSTKRIENLSNKEIEERYNKFVELSRF